MNQLTSKKRQLAAGLALLLVAVLGVYYSVEQNKPTAILERSMREEQNHHKANLTEARERFEFAKKNENFSRTTYLYSLINLASTYRWVGDSEQGDKLYEQAIEYYRQHPDSIGLNYRSLLGYLTRWESQNFKQKFFELTEVLVANPGKDPREVDYEIGNAIRERRVAEKDLNLTAELWKGFIAISEKSPSTTKDALANTYVNYAYACNRAENFKDSERAWMRAISLTKESPSHQAKLALDFSRFYLDNKMFEKAEQAWRMAIAVESGRISTGDGFSRLIQEYKNQTNLNDVEKIVDALLATGNYGAIAAAESPLNGIVDGYIRSGDLNKAESWIQKRIKAAEKCSEDTHSNEWKERLSDLYLATGREKESQKLFNEIKHSTALQGLSLEPLFKKRYDLYERLRGKTGAKQVLENLRVLNANSK